MGRAREEEELWKVLIPLPDDAWHGQVSETVWAETLPTGHFRLRNVPFYARGLSFGDVVATRETEESPCTFDRVIERSGHSTYRIRLSEAVSLEDLTFDRYWQPLEAEGCTYERGTERLIAVDVPDHAHIHRVYELLAKGEEAGAWSFEEGHCAHVAPK